MNSRRFDCFLAHSFFFLNFLLFVCGCVCVFFFFSWRDSFLYINHFGLISMWNKWQSFDGQISSPCFIIIVIVVVDGSGNVRYPNKYWQGSDIYNDMDFHELRFDMVYDCMEWLDVNPCPPKVDRIRLKKKDFVCFPVCSSANFISYKFWRWIMILLAEFIVGYFFLKCCWWWCMHLNY